MATCLCAVMNDNWGFGRFHSSGKLHPLPPPLVLWFFSLLLLFFSPPSTSLCLFIALFSRLYSFGVIFSLSLPVWLSIFFLFLSASPLRCQRFTLDIQLLAGHSIVISFRAAPFSAGPQTAIQITSSAAFRVAALQNVVFKQFWGHHLIWSHKHNWMSVVT